MKSSITERKFLFLTLLAIFMLMALNFFQPQLSDYYDPKDYLGIHTILEFFSISVSAAIFLYGLKSYGATKSARMLLLSFTFFQVGTIDLFHTITFKGMPPFLTESSVAKATWFWVVARVLESLLVLVLITFPNRKLKRDYRGLMLATVVILTSFIVYIVFHYEKILPLLVIEGKGTTPLKNMIEYGVSFIQFLSIIIMLCQYFLEKNGEKLTIAIAFVFLLLSELIFTTYQSVDDLANFTGHLYKAIGYYFILKSFYFTEPSSEVEKLSTMLSDLPGIIFKLEIRRNDGICTFCDGELLKRLGLFSKEMTANTALRGIFDILGHSAEDYCLSSGTKEEHQTFTTIFKGKSLLVSIKRHPVSKGIRTIVGTVVELEAAQPAEEVKQIKTSKLFRYENAKGSDPSLYPNI